MPKCIELCDCDWLNSNLCYHAIEQVYLIKWPASIYIYIYAISTKLIQNISKSWTWIILMALNPDSQLCYTWFAFRKMVSSTSIELHQTFLRLSSEHNHTYHVLYSLKTPFVLHAPQSKPILSTSVWLGMIKVWVSMALRASSDAHSKDDDLLCSSSMLKLTISTKEDHTCFPDCNLQMQSGVKCEW